MKNRHYFREELDTPDEIVAEFQKLRDECKDEVNSLRQEIEQIKSAKKRKDKK